MKKVLTALLLVLSMLTACCIFASAASSQGGTAEPYVLQPGEYYKCDHTPVSRRSSGSFKHNYTASTYSYRQVIYPSGYTENYSGDKGHTCMSVTYGGNPVGQTDNSDPYGKSSCEIIVNGIALSQIQGAESHGKPWRNNLLTYCWYTNN